MLSDCFIFGVNHHVVETDRRGEFSISPENKELFYEKAISADFKSLTILNTCNRTEILGIGDPNSALDIYFSIVTPDSELKDKIFIKKGKDAIEHLFHVAAGLDSKVIGDLEILGQIKDAFRQSKKYGLLNGYFERVANNCMQVAKEIRNTTQISNGTTSLAYSVVKFLKESQVKSAPKILLIGAGSFAKHIGQNVVDYMPKAQLFITNRTDSRAIQLADQLQATQINFTDWKSDQNHFDIIVSAVTAPQNYLLSVEDAERLKNTYILDMSVPYSINPDLKKFDDIHFLTIDELSEIVNNTLEIRKSEIPLAKEIIDRNLQSLYQWSEFSRNTDLLKNWKKELYSKVAECPFLQKLPTDIVEWHVNKSISQFALYIKTNQEVPTDTTQFLNTFLNIYHQAVAAPPVANSY